MEQLQEAIKNITYYGTKFPEKEFEIICANKDAAVPYLRSAIEKAIEEKDDLEENYRLHFYAMYLLAQFQDREIFPAMMKLMCLPGETLDYLIGDALTESAKDILYHTYNGDLQLLKQAVGDISVDEFARSAMLNVMGQLYLDQRLDRQEWQEFLRGLVYQKETLGEYIYIAIKQMICKCHFIEMLPEIRQLYQDERLDLFGAGQYDECVDNMFEYRESDKTFCRSEINAAKLLRGWAMFEDSSAKQTVSDKERSKAFNDLMRQAGANQSKQTAKIGRNDLCPCGSGKKYKKCCMNKSQDTTGIIESEQEQAKWLKYYPPAKPEETEETKGRIYLEDFYDQESREIDKLLYLAMKNRVRPLWQREPKEEADQRARLYLISAFKKFKEFVHQENIQSFSEYDSKYSIHYFCDEWTSALCELLEARDDEGILPDIQEICKKMK